MTTELSEDCLAIIAAGESSGTWRLALVVSVPVKKSWADFGEGE